MIYDSDLDRFFAKVEDWSSLDKCWIWKASTIWEGYGRFWYEGRNHPAHRWLYEKIFGKIADRLVCDHLCRVIACINPLHIEVVTQSTNILRGDSFERSKTHCPYGHEYSKENTYTTTKPNGLTNRHCKKCAKIKYATIKH